MTRGRTVTDPSSDRPTPPPLRQSPAPSPPPGLLESPSPADARAALAGVASRAVLSDDALVVETWATVVWNLLTEPGDGVAGRLVAERGAAEALGVFDGRGPGRGESGVTPSEIAAGLLRWKPRLQSTEVPDAAASARRSGVRLLTRADREWPDPLADLGGHAPLCLWVLGDPARLRSLSPAVAVVGARAATGYGEHVAMELAADLAGSDVAVVSGAAYGIDGAAHRAALSAGGLTVALLAGGLDRPYPAGHAQLIDRIAAAGVVLSEAPCGSTPTKWRFLQRNRLIAAIADATVVVEAGWRSGSLNTAGHAAALGRPLGAVPGPVTSAASAGCHRLLREFDARCVTTADDVRELLGLDGAKAAESGTPSRERSRVLDALTARTPRTTEEIARRSGMSETEVAGVLGLLALDGGAVADADGWRRA